MSSFFSPEQNDITITLTDRGDVAARDRALAHLAAGWWADYLTDYARMMRPRMGQYPDPTIPVKARYTPSGVIDLRFMAEQAERHATASVVASLTEENVSTFRTELAARMVAEMRRNQTGTCLVDQHSEYDCEPILRDALRAAGIEPRIGLVRPTFERGMSTLITTNSSRWDAVVMASLGDEIDVHVQWNITFA